MNWFLSERTGRVVIIELERGEKIIEKLEEALRSAGIKNGYIASGIGSVQKLSFHRPLTFAEFAEDEFIECREPFELGCISGTVIDGVAHLHVVAGSAQSMRLGHLEPDTEALYLVEMTVVELHNPGLERRLTKQKVKKLFAV